MAGRGGTMQVAAAAGVAAGAGAAQLGLGYGLGVVVWPAVAGVDDSVWLGSLGWATWIAASSTVFGAIVAGRSRGPQGGAWRFALALSAGVGALLTVALVALPARLTVRPQTPSPESVAAGYALVGVLIGVVVAYWAVFSRPVAANLMVTAGYLWALAATAIVVELVSGRDSATYLTSWQFADVGDGTRYGTIHWPSSLLTLLAALLIGMVAAWPAVRRGHYAIGAATSGAVGPLLVAAAFLVLAPRLTGTLGQLGSAYLIAPYAVLAGLAGSAFVVAIGQRAAERRKREHHRPAPASATGVATVADGGEGSHGAAPGPATGEIRAEEAAVDPWASTAELPLASGQMQIAGAGSSPPSGPTAGDAVSLRQESTGRDETAPLGRGAADQAETAPLGRGAARQDETASVGQDGAGAGAARGAARPSADRPSARAVPFRSESSTTEQESRETAKPAPKRRRPAGATAAAKPERVSTPRASRAATDADSTADRGARSTVAAPPASPPVARINPPREPGER